MQSLYIECDIYHIQFFVHMRCDQLVSRLMILRQYYLHTATANLSCSPGIRIFSNLPYDLESLMNEKAWFQIALK